MQSTYAEPTLPYALWQRWHVVLTADPSTRMFVLSNGEVRWGTGNDYSNLLEANEHDSESGISFRKQCCADFEKGVALVLADRCKQWVKDPTTGESVERQIAFATPATRPWPTWMVYTTIIALLSLGASQVRWW